jgi:cytochrome P450
LDSTDPIPSVRGLPFIGVLLSIRKNPLKFFSRILRERGDRVQFRVLGRNILLLAHPDDLEQVLIKHREVYRRSAQILSLRALFGQGLLASDGVFWKRQRAMIQPSFDRHALNRYGCIMIDRISTQMAEWRPGAIRDVHADMMRYTRETICAVLFGGSSAIDHSEMASNVSTVFGDLRSELLYLRLWRYLPFGRSVRWNRAVAALNDSIQKVIEARRSSPEPGDDLLAVLMKARDAEGTSMSNQQLHDEILTLFLAGHETAALALTWTVYLLASHTRVQELATDEVKRVTQSGGVTVGHYGELRYLAAVVKEAMRLYPPVWSLGRQAVGRAQLGEISVAEGTEVWMCIHALQRDARWYDRPDEFRPERWLDDEPRQPFTYMPFGAGPRVCIGQHFAMMEAVLGLAAMLKQFRFVNPSNKPAEVSPWLTLRPKRPILVRVLGNPEGTA